MSYRFLEAGKLGDIPILGENLNLVSSGYSHPLYHVKVSVTDMESLTALARLKVEAVWLNFELPWILNLQGREQWCAHIGTFNHKPRL